MNPNCIRAVNQAAGRILSSAEINGIDDRMLETRRRLAQTTPNWRSMPLQDQVMMAAQVAMRDMQAQAARKIDNAQRQVISTVATNARIDELQSVILKGRGTRGDAHIAEINNTQLYIDGLKSDLMSRLKELMHAATSKQDASLGRSALMFLFNAENPKMTRDLVHEIYAKASGATGNVAAQKAAKAWLDVAEEMRQRFNASGGDVRKLGYGYIWQTHDAGKVGKVSSQDWASKVLPLLDRSRYKSEGGARLSDAEVRAIIEGIHSNILEGALPIPPVGAAAKANAHAESRHIHFKDADGYLAYESEFGKGTAYDAILGHITAMTRDIGLIERYGPNPEAQFRLQRETSIKRDGGGTRSFLNTSDTYWSLMTGKTGTPASILLADAGQGIRNIQVAGKLAGALVSSLTDIPVMLVTTGYHKLSYFELYRNIKDQATSAQAREFAISHGVIAETLAGGINRWAGENLTDGWTGRIANSTMKLSFLSAWTDTLRSAFSVTMMQGLGNLAKKPWVDLTPFDQRTLLRKGVTEADWGVINQAQLTMKDGRPYLTPESIRASGAANADQVVSRLMGLVKDTSETAIINPDLSTRAVQTWGGLQSGTAGGEIAKTIMQFKSFPTAMISRHWRRMLDSDGDVAGAPKLANPLAYGSALFLSTTVFGAMVLQAKELLGGNDPIDMDPTSAVGQKFWTKSFAQGGGASFMADILVKDTTADRSSLDTFSRMTMGPTFGSLADAFELTKGNIDEEMAGKDSQAGAETLKFVRSHTPYVNLWQIKGALNGMLINDMQEALSPGYMGRMRGLSKKNWGNDSWLQEERAPSLGAAFGGE